MIIFEDVNKTFGTYKVLDNLNLEIRKGEITFIVGKSGEGKSVTVKHIMGLLRPDSGNIVVDGVNIAKLSAGDMREFRRKFGILFQHAALFDSMTVEENVSFPIKENSDLPTEQIKVRVNDVLTQAGLPGSQLKYPSQLSTGEKKRVGLARALAAKPEFLIYDEPTTGMDPLISEMIDNLIVKVNQDETDLTSIVISHDLKAAMATADNIIMLYKGKVVLEGSPMEFKQTDNPIVNQFFSGKIEGPMEFI